MTVENKNVLIARVQKVKKYFKYREISREEFVDDVFGLMTHKQHARVVNLWQCKIADKDFTEKMERYALDRYSNPSQHETFKKFMDFVNWYMKLGGAPLSPRQIEDCYVRFIEQKPK